MGKLKVFGIMLYNTHGIYYPGQTVQGHCTVDLAEEMSIRGIRLKFEGQANVSWTEESTSGTGENETKTTTSYTAHETYFSQETLLLGIWPKQGSDVKKLAAGLHTFPFSFLLPQNLPPSFEGSSGNIRYSIKGTIDKPWKFDHHTKRLFSVIGHLDLNSQVDAARPVQAENRKMLCCLCCASGPIIASLRLERKGYVPGEAVPLFADITNYSDCMINSSFVDLIMITTFHATNGTTSSSKKIGRITEGPVEPGKSFSWTGKKLQLPPLPPSHLPGCKIIDVQYILQLTVDPSGPSFDLVVPLEIIIGTIPLRHVFEHYQPPVMLQPQGFGHPGVTTLSPVIMDEGAFYHNIPASEITMPTMPSTNFPNMPPPSYAECVFGKVNARDKEDNEYTRGCLEFAPVYTYYGHYPASSSGSYK